MKFTLLSVVFLFFNLNNCVVVNSSSNHSSGTNGGEYVSPTPSITPLTKKTPDLQIMSSEKLRCGYLEDELQMVNNIDSQTFEVRLVKSDGNVRHTVNLPTPNEFGNFGLGEIKVTKKGFEIGVDWGTRIYHDMRFNFECKQNEFFLTKIEHDTFDKHYPEKSSEYKHRKIQVVPNIPLEKFMITDYMVD